MMTYNEEFNCPIIDICTSNKEAELRRLKDENESLKQQLKVTETRNKKLLGKIYHSTNLKYMNHILDDYSLHAEENKELKKTIKSKDKLINKLSHRLEESRIINRMLSGIFVSVKSREVSESYDDWIVHTLIPEYRINTMSSTGTNNNDLYEITVTFRED